MSFFPRMVLTVHGVPVSETWLGETRGVNIEHLLHGKILCVRGTVHCTVYSICFADCKAHIPSHVPATRLIHRYKKMKKNKMLVRLFSQIN